MPVVVERVEPPDVFASRWLHPDGAEALPGNSLEVEFALTRMGDKTQVRVTESGLLGMEWSDAERATYASEHGSGWEVHLRNLREYVHDTAMRSTPTHRESPPLPNNVAIITRFEHAFRAADQRTIDAQQPFMGSPRQVSGYGSKV